MTVFFFSIGVSLIIFLEKTMSLRVVIIEFIINFASWMQKTK